MGGCDIAAETKTKKCGIICGENAMEQFEIALPTTRHFTKGVAPIVSFSLRWRARLEFNALGQLPKISSEIYSC